MRKSLALYGTSEESLHLVPLLEANPGLEIAIVFDEERANVNDCHNQLPTKTRTSSTIQTETPTHTFGIQRPM